MISRLIAAYSGYIPSAFKERGRFLYDYLRAAERAVLRATHDDRTINTGYGISLRIDQYDLAQNRFTTDSRMGETAMIEFFLDEIVELDGDLLDIGANVGFYSLLFQKHNDSDDASAIAFEPLQDNIDRIEKNAKLNDLSGITVHPVALSDHSGKDVIRYDPSNRGGASLVTRPGVFKKSVKVQRLDDTEISSDQIGLIKIDVEGAELDVLKGAEKMLAKMQPELLIEIHPEALAARGQSVQAMTSLLSNCGYNEVVLVGDRKRFDINNICYNMDSINDAHAICCRP